MNIADYVILAILALSVLLGLMRGFVAEVISLACWIAAFWVAWLFGHAVADWYARWLHEEIARIVAGYMTCFLGVLMLGAIVGWIMRKLVQGGGLSGGDRLLGMLFGFARGALVVVVAVWMLAFTPASAEPWWRRSTLLPQFAQGAGWLSDHMPADVAQYMRNGVQVLHQGAQALPKLPDVPTSVPRIGLPALPASSSSTARAPDPARGRGHASGNVGQ